MGSLPGQPDRLRRTRPGQPVRGGLVRGRVVAVNVGRPREVQYQGRTVRTGIFKEQVTGRISESAAGLAGDGQAGLVVHGGPGSAVYAYPAAHLKFWRASLGLEELGPGWFGQNL